MIEAYAGRYPAGTVIDAFADEAIRDSNNIQLDTAKIRQRVWKKICHILPATTTTRLFQLGNKMDAEVDYVLAGGIPQVNTN